jgi:hypothetical protein
VTGCAVTSCAVTSCAVRAARYSLLENEVDSDFLCVLCVLGGENRSCPSARRTARAKRTTITTRGRKQQRRCSDTLSHALYAVIDRHTHTKTGRHIAARFSTTDCSIRYFVFSGLVGLVVVPLAEPAALPLADPAALPLVDPPSALPDGDVLDPPIAPPVELPVEPLVDPVMPLPVVPPVDPPIDPAEPLVDPFVELPMLPVVPLVDPLLPGDTLLDEPLPRVPLPVLPLDAPAPFFACPGGTPVRDAAFSLLPGVRPFARDAASPLLPGDRCCMVSLCCTELLPLDISCEPLDPLDMLDPLDPPDMPDPLLAANVKPETPSAAAIATASVVFLILKPPKGWNVQLLGRSRPDSNAAIAMRRVSASW